MKPILIIKTGSTFEGIIRSKGDFENWTADVMGLVSEKWQCINVQDGEILPDPDAFVGCVITGSHDMITEDAKWMLETTEWVRQAVQAGLPMLGICFGHQLMANALGGKAAFHPDGMEIGTVSINLKSEAIDDPLFSGISGSFQAHVTHSQTVLELPPEAILLGSSDHEAHQAFRVGEHTWGVQFHPEFDAEGTRFYVEALRNVMASQGLDGDAVFAGVEETPVSAGVLKRFGEYCYGGGRKDTEE
jgi:GMP synthase (glutamine-hydrolysing)